MVPGVVTKIPSETKQRQISFANTIVDNVDFIISETTSGMKPAEISIDGRQGVSNGFSIPEMPNDGKFIRQGYEPIKEYDLKNV